MVNGRYIPLVDMANGVVDKRTGRFYPYEKYALHPTVVGASYTLGVNGQRLFLKHVSIITRMVAADTTSNIYTYGTVDGAQVYLSFVYPVPSVAAMYNADFDVGMLLDNTTMTAQCDALPTTCSIACVYALVEDI